VLGKIDSTLGVEGPMARNVTDLALFLDAMSGFEPGDPLSLLREVPSFSGQLRRGDRPKRVAVSRDLGITPVEPVVSDAVMAAARKLEDAGVIVEEAHPDLREDMSCFQTLRALGFATGLRSLLRHHRDQLKPEVIWNIEKGLALSVDDIAKAEAQRATLYKRMQAFLEHHEFLLCPATIVPPFPVEQRYVEACAGVTFETYVDWLLIAAVATLAACPALSMPCGFTAGGLPIGLQVIGPNRSEGRLLAAARFMEDVLGLDKLTPIEPRVTRHG
jgi:amidase